MLASFRTYPGLAGLLALLGPLVTPATAEVPPLTQRINQAIQEQLDREKIPVSSLADDSEFLRRVYLDITGRIPTYEQTTAFLDSKQPDKRTRLIDELLGRQEYGLHFATVWRDLIVDRTPENSQVRQAYSWEFITWLAEEFNKGKGWNETVTAMLTAEGESKKNPATMLVLANRMSNYPRPPDLVSTTGRLFMGMQLRCAQCHDHPYVPEWKQDDFWGLAAFFSQVRDLAMKPDGSSPDPSFFEKPNPDAKKETSYLNRAKREGFLPPLIGAQISIPGQADLTKAARVARARFFLGTQPELSAEGPYRPRLAAWLTAPENPYFARAAVNRLWSHFFARGLVHPVDDMRPDQAASHPQLLDLLEKEFKTHGFNHKHLIRCICNSQAYQRTSRPLPKNASDRTLFSHQAIKLLSPDQTIDSLAIAVGRPPATGKNRDQMTTPFVTKEADADATEFTHGIPQFLLQMNAGPANSPPALLGKLTTKKPKEEAVTALYLAALSRSPRPEELKRMLAYLDTEPNLNKGYSDIYWVLLNSAEFILNH